jgi:hypothetical protein
MKKLFVTGALIAAVAVPTAATAEPTSTDAKNAAKECKALRAASGEQNFRNMFGGKKNAYGKCVSQRSRSEEKQREAAKTNAAKECKALRDADPQGFKDQYKNLGRCVSQKSKENKQAADQQDQQQVNAAKKCKADRKADPEAFATKWGKKRNAFGKCVSTTAREAAGQYEQQS